MPRTHDLVGVLDELLSSSRVSPSERARISELRTCAHELGYEEHVRSDYGEESSFTTPWELFGQEDAERALEIARRACAVAKAVVQAGG